MFETIDNVTMINESTGAFPDAAHRPARRWPGAVLQGQYPLVLDALQAAGAAWHTAAPCLRPRLCIDLYDATCADELPSAQNIYNELKPLVGFIVAGELATTVKVGQELRGARVGGSRRPLLPLGDGSRAALKKLLTYVQ
jgi:4-hydroxy-tetrahydrodipicolinate synthase